VAAYLPPEVQILGDSGPILAKRFREQPDSPFRLRQVVVSEVEVEQVNVPRQFDLLPDVGLDDLPCDRQRRVLGGIMNVAIAGLAELLVLLGQQPLAQLGREPIAGLDAHRSIVRGERCLLVQPFPQDAQTNLPGRHVLHQVQIRSTVSP
jgi:hypothetical protein